MVQKELRIALVLNGGVSLAVWMGGVVHELDLLRRASAPRSADGLGPRDYDEAVFARWRELSRSADLERRVVVDVVAGTSAGGLNGSLLAMAIASGGTLDPADGEEGPWLRERWAELGALSRLLPDGSTPVPSVLDGGYFLDQLREVLRGVATGRAGDPVTLFLTASGLGPHDFLAQDAAQQGFTVADHRFLYRFSRGRRLRYRSDARYEQTEVSDFETVDALAEASRASASFPAAFAPIRESERLDRQPPRIRPRVRMRVPPSWLMDGGVLDNAPFGPVLDEIARRPVSEPTGEYVRSSRHLLYVVPSSGGQTSAAELTTPTEPGWRHTVLSAIRYPTEADFRSDVEDLERLLLEADASWSDTQRLQDTCLADPSEADRVRQAAIRLLPAYARGRAAGGVWEAITVASPDGTTVLDAAAPITADDVAEILAAQPLWLPPPGAGPVPLIAGADERPSWRWGTGPAERVLRLMLRSRRSRVDPASSAGVGPPPSTPGTAAGSAEAGVAAGPAASVDWETALVEIDSALTRVVAVRDALTERVSKARFRPSNDKRAVTVGVNQLFEELDVPGALGAAVAPVAALLPGELDTALAVEIVSRCTSARTPLQRSAPFRFLRLGPDVPLPVLAGTRAEQQAAELGDRILFGTQVNHFGAFGAIDWRRWDWLLGRLHGAAHLARMFGADEAWIRETQLAILQAERSSLTELTDKVGQLADAFPSGPGGGRRALITMRDQLNDTPEGEATVRGLADRLVAVSPGLSRGIGQWAQAVLKREWNGTGVLYRWARWFTEPARLTLWQRLVRSAPQSPAPRPWPLAGWLVAALLLASAALIAAALAASGVSAVLLGVLAGVVLTVAGALLAARRWIDQRRRQLRERIAGLLPELPPRRR